MSERKNDFSVGSIPKNILSMALPMTVAQLVNVLYSVVDRIYLGHLPGSNHLALTGIGVTMPIVSVIMGLANLCGTGGAPLCSMARGRGDNEDAERTMGNAFALLMVIGIAATTILLIIKRPMLYAFGASDDTFPYADEYLTIYLLGTLFVMVSLGMNPFINAQGFGRVGMMTVVLGAVTNIILDPILILWCHMGVKGAALATILAQGLSCLWVLRFLTGDRGILKLRRRHIRLERQRTGRIIGLGLSGFFMNLTNSLVQVVCNATLLKWGGDLYVGVMTIINSVREVVVMPVHGLNNGSQPVTSYNYGAKQYLRVREAMKFTICATVGYSAAFWALAMLMPAPFIHIFNSEPEIIAAGVPAFRQYFCLFIFMALQMSSQHLIVSLGRAKQAIFFSLFRKAIINAPLTVILPHFMGVSGVFYAEAISQLLGGLASSITMYFTVYKPLGDPKKIAEGKGL